MSLFQNKKFMTDWKGKGERETSGLFKEITTEYSYEIDKFS